MLNELLLAHTLTVCAYCASCFGKNCSVSCIHFKLLINVILVIKILDQNTCEEVQFNNGILRSSLLVYLSRILTTNSRTFF